MPRSGYSEPSKSTYFQSKTPEWLFLVEKITATIKPQEKCDRLKQKIDQNQIKIPSQIIDLPFSLLKEEIMNLSSDRIIKNPHTKEVAHLFSHCLSKNLKTNLSDHRIAWQSLERLILTDEKDSRFAKLSLLMTRLWYLYLTYHGKDLKKNYAIPFRQIETVEDLNLKFVKVGDALLTPGLKSMWEHCRKRFEWTMPGWNASLQHGFQSDTYQFFRFVRHSKQLAESIAQIPPPRFGGYQQQTPDIKIALQQINGETQPPPWTKLYQNCKEFGFSSRIHDLSTHPDILSFSGIGPLYEEIFTNELVPRRVAKDLKLALEKTQFYPSPTGLRMILALSAQESTVQWNPKLNKHKKKLLRRRFNNILLKIKSLLPETVSDLILSEEYKDRLDQLIIDLNSITDDQNESIREYDFYIWSRQTLRFIETLTDEYQEIATVGQWFINLQRIVDRLKFEPQTFGLWQVNVNHLIEKMNTYQQLRRVFPQIYYKNGGSWKVKREWLIDSLSGRPNARLNREKTLELIIHTHLKPRYEVHHLGDEADLEYFVAENMSGEMSTYRAAIQDALNHKIKTTLKVDGDLTYYQPYSKKIRWAKPSRTYQALIQFVEQHQYYFSQGSEPEELARTICIANSREKLISNELYRKLMGKSTRIRIFPQIKSSLYDQTPYQYARIVRMKSRLF